MKRFLSLVLSLVMVMSLVTVSAGAKDFTDNDTIAYDEAVAVVSEVGIVDGYADGDFKPTNTLTRQAAAKIICNLILGPTTAAELHADTAPYPDVPTTSEFAGYIAFCQSRKIISGYSDGNFRPGATLTGYAFMKMLLGALGYDASLEGYTGSNWSINVAKQALGIGLDDGLETKDGAVFNGLKAVTREEACLYAFNTLQADLVEYGQRLTTNINGTEVTLSSGGATSRTWQSQNSRNDNIVRDNIMQFAEEYFNKLVKRDATDKFMRPANTWLYDKVEIGTWTDFTLLVERYTAAITGKDVYDLLGQAAIRDNTLLAYVDGQDSGVTKDDLVRTNKNDLTKTGNGVLTEIFLDTDTDELTIASIHTYLAQATDNYNETKEYAPLEVWGDFDYDGVGDGSNGRNYNVDVEDVKNVEDVEDEEFYLVNISYKDAQTTGEVVILSDVEIMEDSAVSKFSAGNQGNGTSRVTKLTTGGTEYKNNYQAWYDEDILDTYDDQLLTDNSYNVFMDQYGYFIGVSLFEGTKNYVFITGFDRGRSNISVKTADATGIFLDGTMDTIRVNVSDTDENIEDLFTTYTAGTVASGGTPAVHGTYVVDTDYAGTNANYFRKWNDVQGLIDNGHSGDGGVYNLNQWYTYTENNGTYTLKPCARMTWTKYTDPVPPDSNQVTLKTDKLDVVDTEGNGKRVYGEDESAFITVELDTVDTSSGARAIYDVSGVYSGVQNVEIEIDQTDPVAVAEGQVYTVYDKNFFVIGAVIIGEGNGANANYAYIIEGPKSEEKIDDTYYWEFEAIVGGEIKTLTAKSKFSNTINPVKREQGARWSGTPTPAYAALGMNNDHLVELRFDGDYVINIKDIDDIYYDTEAQIDGQDFYDVDSQNSGNTVDAGFKRADYRSIDNMLELSLQGRTLYVTPDQTDVGLALASDCKAVVIQKENGKLVKTEFTSVKSAIARVAEPAGELNTAGIQYEGRVVAALNSSGVAQWIVFVNDNELRTGSNAGFGGEGQYDPNVSGSGATGFQVRYHDPDNDMTNDDVKALMIETMERYTGLRVKSYNYPLSTTMVFEDGSTFGAGAVVTPVPMVRIYVDGKSIGEFAADGAVSRANLVPYLAASTSYLVNKDAAATADIVTDGTPAITTPGSDPALTAAQMAKDVYIYTANTVTAAAADSITYTNTFTGATGVTFTSTNLARKGLVLTLNKNAAAGNYQQWVDNDGNNVGKQAAPGADLSAKYTVVGSGTETLTVKTGVMVKVGSKELGVISTAAPGNTVTFSGYAGGTKFAAEKVFASDKSHVAAASLAVVTENADGFTYTYTAGDVDTGVITLVPVVQVTFTAADVTVDYTDDAGSAGGLATTNYVKIGVELTATETASDAVAEKIQLAVNGGTPADFGTAGTAADKATGTYTTQAGDRTLAFTLANV